MATKHIPIPKREPGRPVGVVAVWNEGNYIATILWTVSKYRRDYNLVNYRQAIRDQKLPLPKYEESLFNSMFKNWG